MQVALELAEIERELARRSLLTFTQYTRPDYEVNWHHRLVGSKLDDVLSGKIRRLMIFEPPQNGKLCKNSTPVFTTRGWTTHGDLKIGDEVFGPDGLPTRVVALSEEGVADIEMVFTNGEVIQCHERHEWVVWNRSYDDWKVYEAGWFLEQTKFGKPRQMWLGQRNSRGGRAIYSLPLVESLQFPEAELRIDPYVLGVWLGDGTSKMPRVTMTLEDSRNVMPEFVAAGYDVSAINQHSTSGVLSYGFGNPRGLGPGQLTQDLRALSLIGAKHIPLSYLRSSVSQRLQLLAGLIDTDGHVEEKTNRVHFVTSSEDLRDGVLDLCTTLGFRPRLSVRPAVTSSSGIVGKKTCYAVIFQPTRSIPTRIPRKAVTLLAPQRRIGLAEVRRCTPEPGRCIQVARLDGLYLVGRTLLVTHNSEQVSRRFPAYAFGRNPDLHIIACSYNASLAQDMSRDVQKIMSTREYRALFPGTHLAEARFEIDPVTGRRTHAEKRTQSQFDIVNRKGMYNAAGVAGPITGKTADIGIIDDPVKNRAEAESELYRDRVWEWYKSAFSTRQFGAHGAIIICLTRWHTDDLAGRLLALAKNNPDADQWEVITLPSYWEPGEEIPDYDPRTTGEALWPDKYPLEELAKRRAFGEYDFAALYQQKPAPSGGGLFKEAWFADKFVDAAPALMRVARGWDTAGTEGGGDYTVGVKIGEEFTYKDKNVSHELVSTGRFFILDVVRGQWGPAGVDAIMKSTAELDGECAQREEQEMGASGKAVIEARTKALAGFDHAPVIITGSKVTRSKPFRSQCEAGNVYILRDQGRGGVEGKGWNLDYVKELCAFPTGKNDDQVDGSSAAFNSVLLEPVPEEEWLSL